MDYSKFQPFLGDWGPRLKTFIESKEMDEIYKKIKADRKLKPICPASFQTYRAFEKCPFSSVKVIIFGQDPYPKLRNGEIIADGLAFSCGNTKFLQPSLVSLYEAIEDDLYNGMELKYKQEEDLSYLAEQGVLLLNTALTVRKGEKNSHQDLWRPFMKYLLEEALLGVQGLVFILMGDEAVHLEQFILPWSHWVYKCEHPARCTYSGGKMKHNNVFSNTNKTLKKINGNSYQINWLNIVEP